MLSKSKTFFPNNILESFYETLYLPFIHCAGFFDFCQEKNTQTECPVIGIDLGTTTLVLESLKTVVLKSFQTNLGIVSLLQLSLSLMKNV